MVLAGRGIGTKKRASFPRALLHYGFCVPHAAEAVKLDDKYAKLAQIRAEKNN
jgi:hypothetical protein